MANQDPSANALAGREGLTATRGTSSDVSGVMPTTVGRSFGRHAGVHKFVSAASRGEEAEKPKAILAGLEIGGIVNGGSCSP